MPLFQHNPPPPSQHTIPTSRYSEIPSSRHHTAAFTLTRRHTLIRKLGELGIKLSPLHSLFQRLNSFIKRGKITRT
jgi:hypothetical protein